MTATISYHNNKAILIVLDGWGHGAIPAASAIAQAYTPCISRLYQQYPNAELSTYGEVVGLPHGQMGNSEVGHLNLGAGRVVYQELLRINNAIQSGEIRKNPALQHAIKDAKQRQKPIHLIGLVSDGGVHSHIDHLIGLCHILHQEQVPHVYLHAFTDGRDTDPKSGVGFIQQWLDATQNDTNTQLASIIGRYYAMDRDHRWERIKLAYDLLVHGKGTLAHDAIAAMQEEYHKGITDEFMPPIALAQADGTPVATIQPNDIVLSFNFRTDRGRQITTALTQTDMPEHGLATLPLHYLTMTRYDEKFTGVEIIFEKDNLENTLGEVLARAGKKQIRIAETEKYPHVTFFFSGGREQPFAGESRLMIPSPKVATYDLKPEMSALEVTAAILPEIASGKPDFICLNFANTDMVGHTGVFSAAVKAAETVDSCLEKIIATALPQDYCLMILADHGNADLMINPDGSPNTAHTTNPVPIFLVANNLPKGLKLRNGKLADVAPTLLAIMQLPIPDVMDGNCLLEQSPSTAQ